VLAARMAVRAVDLILEGKTNRVVGVNNGVINDFDISEALSTPRKPDSELYDIMNILAR
jgi:6-phosphofructokinase 1